MTQPRKTARLKRTLVVGWPEILLVASLAVLILQLFPGVSSQLFSALDPLQWTWRAYAIACGIWIVGLVAFKVWRDAAE